MSRKRLALAHEQVGRAEHAVENRLLAHAEDLPDPEHARQRAHEISAAADRHLAEAERLTDAD